MYASQFLILLDCSKSFLDVILVLFTTLPSEKVEPPCDIRAGARQPGGLLPETAARHIQSVRAHMGQYYVRNYFPRDFFGLIQQQQKNREGGSLERLDLISSEFGVFVARRLLKTSMLSNKSHMEVVAMLCLPTQKNHIYCEIQIEWLAVLLVCI